MLKLYCLWAPSYLTILSYAFFFSTVLPLQVVYHLENVDGDEKDLFSISTVNGKGVVKLIGRLDYEKKFLHQLKILAVDRSNNDRVSILLWGWIISEEIKEDSRHSSVDCIMRTILRFAIGQLYTREIFHHGYPKFIGFVIVILRKIPNF